MHRIWTHTRSPVNPHPSGKLNISLRKHLGLGSAGAAELSFSVSCTSCMLVPNLPSPKLLEVILCISYIEVVTMGDDLSLEEELLLQVAGRSRPKAKSQGKKRSRRAVSISDDDDEFDAESEDEADDDDDGPADQERRRRSSGSKFKRSRAAVEEEEEVHAHESLISRFLISCGSILSCSAVFHIKPAAVSVSSKPF